uniref:Uncharacterized protein MANES_08G097600 n=1 Tax=Rhizophora mucronata TaxID=61149 RepID=A0A2P2JMU6_RHIMU
MAINYSYPGILSTSNSTPSLTKTNTSFTKGRGVPLPNNCGLRAIPLFRFFFSHNDNEYMNIGFV